MRFYTQVTQLGIFIQYFNLVTVSRSTQSPGSSDEIIWIIAIPFPLNNQNNFLGGSRIITVSSSNTVDIFGTCFSNPFNELANIQIFIYSQQTVIMETFVCATRYCRNCKDIFVSVSPETRGFNF